MDLHRQLQPLHADLAEVLTRDDLSDWARERLTTAAVALGDVLFATVERTCEECGFPIATLATGRPRAYCSDSCRQAAYRDRKRGR